jgi:hypothetical protein
MSDIGFSFLVFFLVVELLPPHRTFLVVELLLPHRTFSIFANDPSQSVVGVGVGAAVKQPENMQFPLLQHPCASKHLVNNLLGQAAHLGSSFALFMRSSTSTS